MRWPCFYGDSDALQILAPAGNQLKAPAAELIKRQADRRDLPFVDVMQAELLVFMMDLVTKDGRWHPQTLYYWNRSGAFPFFVRAARHRDFQKLAKITGVSSGVELRAAVKAGLERQGTARWRNFGLGAQSLLESVNIDALDTLS